MSFWSKLGKYAGIAGAGAAGLFTGGSTWAAIPGLVGAGGQILGDIAKTKANNKGETLAANQNQDQINTQRAGLQLDQDAENRAERESAWKMLQRLAYTKDQANPMQRPAYLPEKYYNPNAVRRTSQTELDGAAGLEKELMARLQGGPNRLNIAPLTNVKDATKMSGWEKLLNIAGPSMKLAGNINWGGGEDDPYAPNGAWGE